MKVYLDEDADSDLLISLLVQSGHTAISPRHVGMKGAKDGEHLRFASSQGCVLITFNCADFAQEHDLYLAMGKSHAGIIAIYRDNEPAKNMTPHEIVRALGNLESSGVPLVNGFLKLNEWQY